MENRYLSFLCDYVEQDNNSLLSFENTFKKYGGVIIVTKMSFYEKFCTVQNIGVFDNVSNLSKRLKHELLSWQENKKEIKKYNCWFPGMERLEFNIQKEGFSELITCGFSELNQNISNGEPEGWKFDIT